MRRLLHISLVLGLLTALTGCVIGPTPHPVAEESAAGPGASDDLSSSPTGGASDPNADQEDGSEPSAPSEDGGVGEVEDLDIFEADAEADTGEPDDGGPADDSGPLDDSGPSESESESE